MDVLDLKGEALPLLWTCDYIPKNPEGWSKTENACDMETEYVVGEFNCSCVGVSMFQAVCGGDKTLADVPDADYYEACKLTDLMGIKALEMLDTAAASKVRYNTLLPSPAGAKYSLAVVQFKVPGHPNGGSDKGPDGNRIDSIPIANGVIKAGGACDMLLYDYTDHAGFEATIEKYDALIVRINPGQLSQIPGVDGVQAKFDDDERVHVRAESLGDDVMLKLMEMNDNHVEYHTVKEFLVFCVDGPSGAGAGTWTSTFPASTSRARGGGQLVDQRLLPRISEGEVRVLMAGDTCQMIIHKKPEGGLSAVRYNTLLPSPAGAKYSLAVVQFKVPGHPNGGSDKGPDGNRIDSIPIANGVIKAGGACDMLLYDYTDHAGFEATIEKYDALIVRINPGQLSQIPGVDGVQAKFDATMNAFVGKGKPVWSSPGVQQKMGAKDALCKIANMGCGLAVCGGDKTLADVPDADYYEACKLTDLMGIKALEMLDTAAASKVRYNTLLPSPAGAKYSLAVVQFKAGGACDMLLYDYTDHAGFEATIEKYDALIVRINPGQLSQIPGVDGVRPSSTRR
ncbi:hypothetical protein JL720_3157 [Aureococcus anophagefferens]|nr:hypothetical protein JL720_3157 [Aureococcus anophagefferens]